MFNHQQDNDQQPERGQCIQSKTYPSKGIAIECLSDEDSMTCVACLPALSGCGMRV